MYGNMSRVQFEGGSFAMIPAWLIDAGVSPGAYMLYGLLCDYADRDDNTSFPGRKRLAERLRCSVDTVDRHAKELVEAGALRVEHHFDGGRQTTNIYTLVQMPPGRMAPADEGRMAPAHEGRTDAAPGTRTRGTRTRGTSTTLARARGTGLVGTKVDRQVVTEDEDQKARAVLAEWNAQTGQTLTAKSWLRTIVMRIRERPDLSIVDHGAMIRSVLANPWWTGAASPSVVYGNDRVFDRSLSPPGPRKHPKRYGRGMTTAEMLERTAGR